MGKTLWEMLTSPKEEAIEFQVTNPLKLKIGTTVRVNDIDLKALIFSVKSILEYKRVIGGKEFFFTDYDLLARPLGGQDVKIRLRLNPMEIPDTIAGLTHNVVLLKLYDEMGYNEGLFKVVTDTTKLFDVVEDGICTERYYRINDVQNSYKPVVTIVNETGSEKTNLEYWDYWREAKDEAGQDFNQFLFVEMDADTGYFQMWQGFEIDPQMVSVL